MFEMNVTHQLLAGLLVVGLTLPSPALALRPHYDEAGLEEQLQPEARWTDQLRDLRNRLTQMESVRAVVLDFDDTIASKEGIQPPPRVPRPHPEVMQSIRALLQEGIFVLIPTGRRFASIEESGFLESVPSVERQGLHLLLDTWSRYYTFDRTGKAVEIPNFIEPLDEATRQKIREELIPAVMREQRHPPESVRFLVTPDRPGISFDFPEATLPDRESVAQALNRRFLEDPSVPREVQAYVSTVAVDVSRWDKRDVTRKVLGRLEIEPSAVLVGADSGSRSGNDRGLLTRLGAAIAFQVGPRVDDLPEEVVQLPSGGPTVTALALQAVVERVRQLQSSGLEESVSPDFPDFNINQPGVLVRGVRADSLDEAMELFGTFLAEGVVPGKYGGTKHGGSSASEETLNLSLVMDDLSNTDAAHFADLEVSTISRAPLKGGKFGWIYVISPKFVSQNRQWLRPRGSHVLRYLHNGGRLLGLKAEKIERVEIRVEDPLTAFLGEGWVPDEVHLVRSADKVPSIPVDGVLGIVPNSTIRTHMQVFNDLAGQTGKVIRWFDVSGSPLSGLEEKPAAEEDFLPLLTELAQGRPPTGQEVSELTKWLADDPVQTAILGIPPGKTTEEAVRERIEVMQRAWPAFSAWWRSYLPLVQIPVDSLWRVYIPFSQWTIEQVEQKRQSKPEEIFILFVYGNQGGGKTVFTRAIVPILNVLLDPYSEQAVARGFDDYYLGKADREKLRRPGYYDPIPGVSSRGPAGTHNTDWILRNIEEFRQQFKPGAAVSKAEMGNFDKGIDDQPAEPFVMDVSRKKVRVFILDNWFFPDLDFDISRVPEGFKRAHAETLLRGYKPIFDQVDAVFAFKTQPLDVIEANRQEQEDSRKRRGEPRGMTPEAIRYFVRQYFYTDPWHWDPIERTWAVTSPIPSKKNVTFLAEIDANRRFVDIERGGRPTSDPRQTQEDPGDFDYDKPWRGQRFPGVQRPPDSSQDVSAGLEEQQGIRNFDTVLAQAPPGPKYGVNAVPFLATDKIDTRIVQAPEEWADVHWHPDGEFYAVTDGSGQVEVDGGVHTVRAGTFFGIDAKAPHKVRQLGEGPFRFLRIDTYPYQVKKVKDEAPPERSPGAGSPVLIRDLDDGTGRVAFSNGGLGFEIIHVADRRTHQLPPGKSILFVVSGDVWRQTREGEAHLQSHDGEILGRAGTPVSVVLHDPSPGTVLLVISPPAAGASTGLEEWTVEPAGGHPFPKKLGPDKKEELDRLLIDFAQPKDPGQRIPLRELGQRLRLYRFGGGAEDGMQLSDNVEVLLKKTKASEGSPEELNAIFDYVTHAAVVSDTAAAQFPQHFSGTNDWGASLQKNGLSARLLWPRDWPENPLVRVEGEDFEKVAQFSQRIGVSPESFGQEGERHWVEFRHPPLAAFLSSQGNSFTPVSADGPSTPSSLRTGLEEREQQIRQAEAMVGELEIELKNALEAGGNQFRVENILSRLRSARARLNELRYPRPDQSAGLEEVPMVRVSNPPGKRSWMTLKDGLAVLSQMLPDGEKRGVYDMKPTEANFGDGLARIVKRNGQLFQVIYSREVPLVVKGENFFMVNPEGELTLVRPRPSRVEGATAYANLKGLPRVTAPQLLSAGPSTQFSTISSQDPLRTGLEEVFRRLKPRTVQRWEVHIFDPETADVGRVVAAIQSDPVVIIAEDWEHERELLNSGFVGEDRIILRLDLHDNDIVKARETAAWLYRGLFSPRFYRAQERGNLLVWLAGVLERYDVPSSVLSLEGARRLVESLTRLRAA